MSILDSTIRSDLLGIHLNGYTTICKTTNEQQSNTSNNGCDSMMRTGANLAMAILSLENSNQMVGVQAVGHPAEYMRELIVSHGF